MGLIAHEHMLERALLQTIKREEKIQNPEEMPLEFRELTVDLLIQQWLAEHIGGEEYIQCIRLGRTPKEKNHIKHMALEELGHGEIIRAGPLAVLGIDPFIFLSCNGNSYQSIKQQSKLLRVFKFPEILTSSYVNFRIFNLLQDSSADLQLNWIMRGPFGPYTAALRAIELEEEGHVESGKNCVAEITSTTKGRNEAQTALAFWVPLVLDVFGAPDNQSKKLHLYQKWGYRPKHIGNDRAREIYTSVMRPFIEDSGLVWPIQNA